ncbi:11418_t:CDS:10 [Entrophospora sp. SA101]|nr:11418_t:CDS:10 [Entrophospora sp. SA101]CAJ0876433.1 3154_t:CDS:10 [Entrophospora sp. SA101]
MLMEIDSLSIILILLIVLVAFISIRNTPSHDVHPLLLTSQSDPARVRNPDETVIYRSNNSAHGMPLLSSPDKNIKTLADLFLHGTRVGKDCLGFKNVGDNYDWPKSSNNLFGIFMKNCAGKWIVADLAASRYSLITVALPCIPLRLNDIIKQIKLTEINVVIVSKDTLPIIFSAAPSCPTLKYVILAESELEKTTITQQQLETAKTLELNLVTFNFVEEEGSISKLDHMLPDPEDTATIVFTNGTTFGEPKGVELSHKNIVADVAHIFERISVFSFLYSGVSIAFYSRDINQLLNNIQEVQPTIFTSAPRFLTGFQESILQTMGDQSLFKKGYESKLYYLKKGMLLTNSIWDYLVFNGNVKAKFGGKLRVLVVGAGPISQSTLDFLRITVSCQVIQAYGLTQCSGAVTINSFYDYQSPEENDDSDVSQCGAPIACNEIKLISYEEKGYSVEDKPNPRGEICVRGPNVMKGYYKSPNETSQTIASDGWLRTGDIGMILPNGTLKIIDRKLAH